MHPPGTAGFSLKYLPGSNFEYGVQFRLGLHEFHDFFGAYPKNDFIALGKINIGILKNKLLLNELWVFNQKSLKPVSSISNSLSWKLALGGYRRDDLKNRPLSFGVYTGIGKTFSIHQNKAFFSFMFNLSPVYLQNYGASLIAGPEIITRFLFTNYFKNETVLRYEVNTFDAKEWGYILQSDFSIVTYLENQFILMSSYSQNGFFIGIQFNQFIDY